MNERTKRKNFTNISIKSNKFINVKIVSMMFMA